MVQMTPAQKAQQTKMEKQAAFELPATKDCPKCERKRSIKFYGLRTIHAQNGKPERTIVQSWCNDCRSGKKPAKKVEKKVGKKANRKH